MNDLIPLQLLRQYSQDFPQAWRQIARLRTDRGKDLPWWPEWCYCPIAGSIAVITEGAPHMGIIEIKKLTAHPPAVMAALAAWRVTKGVYRFDPILLEEISKMELEGDLPAEIFYSLPEWCIYVETPGFMYVNNEVSGVFVSLEYDPNDHRHELRLVFVDASLKCFPVPLHLGKWTVQEAVNRAVQEGNRVMQGMGLPDCTATIPDAKDLSIIPFVNLVLYVCSINADYGTGPSPQHPSKKPARKGKLQVANDARTWDIGVRIGPALKRAKMSEHEAQERTGERSHASPRSHIRRAHWHHYWIGPRNEPEKRNLILKWLPPIPVGISELDGNEMEMPAVIRPIRKED